ncbi:SDR family NAD(P)-dependent oxidoreductase, partial [Chloroflexi bacterium TSY]|nr:SDR family NAD(P)-dependent oxidoreductase [Chloroflexi bacterium TSY]
MSTLEHGDFNPDEEMIEELEVYLHHHLYPLFQLAGSLIKAKMPQDVQLLYLYQAQDSLRACFEQAMTGFGKTLEQENPKFRFKTIGMENSSDLSLSTLISQEVVANVGDIVPQKSFVPRLPEPRRDKTFLGRYSTNIRYQAGTRQVQTFAPCTHLLNEAAIPQLCKQGTYIITGGTGGIGLIVAEGLLRNYAANLVLVGRSPLNAEKTDRLEALKGLGTGTVTYLQADITSLEETTSLVKRTQSQFGKIHGVIHAAGVIQDSLIPQKTLPQLRTVVVPKIMGALHLDRLLADEMLDLFVLFSSTTAILGNVGQADYGYANRFLDAFASYRQCQVAQGQRHGHTVAINWPLWENGGMQTTPETRQTLAKAGLQPLDDQTGWRAFDTAVNQQHFHQLLFLWQRAHQADETAKRTDTQSARPTVALPQAIDAYLSVPSIPEVEKKGSTDPNATDIAIVGLSGRYPMAESLAEFWENLKAGRDCISEIPTERWHHERDFNRGKHKASKSYSKWGGFMADVDKFDPLFFNISPREAEMMDPQERLFLEIAWQTLEDAGYTRETLATQTQGQVGVFVGAMWSEYQLYAQEQMGLSSSQASIANRISYALNLHGPSLAVDTMCSSSVTSIHLACESIRRGECVAALAGGVNVSIHPNKYRFLAQSNFVSSDGHCRSFGEGGDGYVPGEGVGAVLLKPLSLSEADGDTIYGVIKGSSVNHGGKTSGYTVPNPVAQAQLIAATLEKSGIAPESISYVEAHGTGTSLGDPIEIRGLSQAFGEQSETYSCAIGSVKSNIGHLESAAGIAGLTKVLLQMKHQQLMPSIHSETLNPHIDFDSTPFAVQRELAEWKQPILEVAGEQQIVPRRAGLSSFGAGGANAHLIIEEYRKEGKETGNKGLGIKKEDWVDSEPQVIVLSAKNEERLREYAHKLLVYVEQTSVPNPAIRARDESNHQTSPQVGPSLANIAYTLQVGREAMGERLAFVVSNLEELIVRLRQYQLKENATGQVYQGNTNNSKQTVNLLSGGIIGSAIIKTVVDNREYDKLAQLWVSGVEIEWRLLYGDETPRRIPLPTYPFAKKRYWFDEHMAKSKEEQLATPASMAPLPTTVLPDPPNASAENVPLKHGKQKVVLRMPDTHILPEEIGSAQDNSMRLALASLTEEVENVPGKHQSLEHMPVEPPVQDTAQVRAMIAQQLRQQLVDLLYVELEELDDQAKFLDLGLDSIAGVEWVKRINDTFGLEVNATRFYDYPTIVHLASYLAGMIAQHTTEPVVIDVPVPAQLPHLHLIETQGLHEQADPKEENIQTTEQETSTIDVSLIESRSGESAQQSMQTQVDKVPTGFSDSLTEGIAIIGMSGRFPGANDVEAFWQNLANGVDSIAEVSPERWDVDHYYDANRQAPGKSYSKWLGALEDIDKFDPLFFEISPREAELMDPQQRLF